MSLKTLPILFLNLGGEMLYILDQRLRAQNIPDEKSKKVIHDILGTMLNTRFMDELFKPQDAYSKKAMRTVFDRLAHASIMRLNSASMDKLYDLMTMAFKYQVSLSPNPMDVLMITLNHMDAIREFARGNAQILEQVDYVYDLLNKSYKDMKSGQYQLIRHTLLSFFQDMHIRVSIFLKEQVQTSDGKFVLPKEGVVPWGTDVPGTIRFFDDSGHQTHVGNFKINSKFELADKQGSFELLGDRVTKLGTNMYKASRQIDTAILDTPVEKPSPMIATPADVEENPNKLAKVELNLLKHMISGRQEQGKNDFRLNLFQTDEEEQSAEIEYAKVRHHEIFVDASQRERRSEITQLIDEFSISSQDANEKGDDLLELMDAS